MHRSNITCVRLCPGQERLFTGAGDGLIRCIGFDGEVHWQAGVGAGALLCLDLHPHFRYQPAAWAASAERGLPDCLHGMSLFRLMYPGAHTKGRRASELPYA